MQYSRHNNVLMGLLYQPAYRRGRHLFILLAIIATALSQTFFVFGNHAEISITTIYIFGIGFAAATLSVIYLNVYYLAPHFLSENKYASYMLTLLLVVSALLFLKHLAEYAIFNANDISRKANGITVLDGVSNTILYVICVASTSISILFRKLLADEEEIESLERQRIKKSIAEIKNRIQPKFLHTTLDYVARTVTSKPEQATDTLFKLSELLRYQLYDSTRDKVLISAELTFIRNYLSLHQHNTENSFSFEISVNGDISTFMPPSAISSCVEELLYARPKNLWIHINIENNCIRLECTASGTNLLQKNVEAVEQKLKWLCGHETVVQKDMDTIKTYLTIC